MKKLLEERRTRNVSGVCGKCFIAVIVQRQGNGTLNQKCSDNICPDYYLWGFGSLHQGNTRVDELLEKKDNIFGHE